MQAIVKPVNACFSWSHKWKEVKKDGHNTYYKCPKCEARKVIYPEYGYQPIRWNWLEGKIKIIKRSPVPEKEKANAE